MLKSVIQLGQPSGSLYGLNPVLLILMLLSLMLVSGCDPTRVIANGQIEAMQQELPPIMADHVDALVDCVVPECNAVVLTGRDLIAAVDAGLWPGRKP